MNLWSASLTEAIPYINIKTEEKWKKYIEIKAFQLKLRNIWNLFIHIQLS